jgi:hypothetical protein
MGSSDAILQGFVSRTSRPPLSPSSITKEVVMKRIALAVVAALGLAVGSGSALAQHAGHDGGGGHSGGGNSGWHGGGGNGGWHGGGHGFHGGPRFSVGFGFPGFYGFGYPYYGYGGYPYYSAPYYAAYPYYDAAPYSYYPSDSGYPDQGNYSQRGDMSSGAPPSEPQYQYYCPEPAGYYPQLQSCPKGWLKVVPERSPRPRPQ